MQIVWFILLLNGLEESHNCYRKFKKFFLQI